MALMAKKLQPAKVEAIAEVKSILEGYNDYIFTNYRGLTVEQISALRKQLRGKDCEFKVIKNNFAKVAFDELKVENVADFLTGPTAVALAKEDANEVAKILFDFAKDTPALEIKGGLLDKEVYDAAKIEAFSKLPGKKQLIAMIMSTINAPVQKVAATLQAYVDKKSAEGGEAPAPAAE
ncbi:MAG: 50S ribosomal protein L10 [Treponemataceae bacterium]|nr:50S ribosomal protein L10 [Treponemataceae bacterium]